MRNEPNDQPTNQPTRPRKFPPQSPLTDSPEGARRSDICVGARAVPAWSADNLNPRRPDRWIGLEAKLPQAGVKIGTALN